MASKILVLFWKDLLIRKNHFISTTIEVFIPIGLIILARLAVPVQNYEPDDDFFLFGPLGASHCIPKYSIFGRIIYEPSTPFTDALMSRAACYAGYKKSNVKVGNLHHNSSHFSIGVKFENGFVDGNSETLNYTLFPTNRAWDSMSHLWRSPKFVFPRYSKPTVHTVLELQRAIDASFLEFKNISTKQINFRNLDVIGGNPNVFLTLLHLTVVLTLFLIVPPIIGRTVQEKFTGAKELMLTMGVIRWHLWVSKFLQALFFSSLTFNGMVLVLYLPLEENNFLSIPPLILWSMFMYGLIGIILFLFFASCVFDRPMTAIYLTEIVWCVTYFMGNVISNFIEVPAFFKFVLCLFPHVSLMEGLSILLRFEHYGKDIRLLENTTTTSGSLCLIHVFCFLTVDIILYAVLTWYMEQVKPGRYGLPRPYNFCFKKYYWFPRKSLPSYGKKSRDKVNEDFELVVTDSKPGVMVKNVSKIYRSSEKSFIQAVDNVSLNFYHGEISGVLGHNGAGKTTLFSIITGMTRASDGRVFINGYDLSIDTDRARRSIGLCPQKDMLFDDLTVLQTLKFYGVVKGLTLDDAGKDSMNLIKKLKLTGVKHTQASNLSGGQKRKLSLGIALIGGSEVLILDEPTSGMDPEIRREIWELLLELRPSRTIILTTHFMEEADALCNRIAIMDHGKVKCYGSPMFLKSKYGKGYILNVVVKPEGNYEELEKYVKECIPRAKFQSRNARTISFELHERELPEFPELLKGLEEKRKKNEISSYCLNLSTLEDVFIRHRSDHCEVDTLDSPSYRKLDIPENSEISRVSRCFLPVYQFWALFCKKWLFFLRCCRTFLIFSVFTALITIGTTFSNRDSPQMNISSPYQNRLTYSLDLYPSSLLFYSNLRDPLKAELFEKLGRDSGSEVEKVDDVKESVEEIFDKDFYAYARKINFGVDFSEEELNIFHNHFGIHMVPVSLNFIHNFLLKSFYRDGAITTSVDNRFSNKELLLYNSFRPVKRCRIGSLTSFSGAQTFFYILGPLRESFHGAKEMQLMITPSYLYWLSHLVFDVLSFLVYIVPLVFGLGFSLQDEFMMENAGELLLALVLWGSGLILISYIISTLKKDVAAALSVSIIFYVTFTFIVGNLISMNLLPMPLQYLHPCTILDLGFADLCSGKRNYFIAALLWYDTVLFLYLILTDSGLISRIFHFASNKFFRVDYSVQDGKDKYVEEEEEEVQKLLLKQKKPTLLVNGLRRWYFRRYRPSPAVRGVSFSVNEGECFGLLGVNGAGKTSTFKMLAGSLPPSQGSTYACSQRLTFIKRGKYLFSIGYCPQSGGLIPVFTGKDLLTFFARLKGLKGSSVKDEVEKWLDKLNLLEYAKEECGTYSGGNKRKLSTAIAVIGACPLVFLDEPTSGVDPLSRRSIWSAVEHIQKHGKSVVLTSHSMDECEALCSRLAIMVEGRFHCIGETTTLKERFGLGYCIQLKLSNAAKDQDVSDVKDAVNAAFDCHCELVDEHLTLLQYHVVNEGISWAKLFEILADLKRRFAILESYTASATSLEQIFIHLARKGRNHV